MEGNMEEIEKFIDKLSRETALSKSDCVSMIYYIDLKVGSISTALDLYKQFGIMGLQKYIRLLDAGVIY